MGVSDYQMVDSPMQSPVTTPNSQSIWESKIAAQEQQSYSPNANKFNQAAELNNRKAAAPLAATMGREDLNVTHPHLPPHPAVRLSHIQHSHQHRLNKTLIDADQTKYRHAMQKKMEAELSHQIEKSFAPTAKKLSRDSHTKNRPQSLAATHPANYGSKKTSMMPPPLPTKPFSQYAYEEFRPPLSIHSSPKQMSPRSTPAEPPWRQYTDPMHQTSSDPHFWGQNHTVLRKDTNLEPGNVISPTGMVGLPFGGMIELGHCYTTAEGRKRAASVVEV